MRKIYRIEGMTCSACSAAVEKAVGRLEGVERAEVNLASEKLVVEFDPGRVGRREIFQAVEKAGYMAVEDRDLKRVLIPIEGMT